MPPVDALISSELDSGETGRHRTGWGGCRLAQQGASSMVIRWVDFSISCFPVTGYRSLVRRRVTDVVKIRTYGSKSTVEVNGELNSSFAGVWFRALQMMGTRYRVESRNSLGSEIFGWR